MIRFLISIIYHAKDEISKKQIASFTSIMTFTVSKTFVEVDKKIIVALKKGQSNAKEYFDKNISGDYQIDLTSHSLTKL